MNILYKKSLLRTAIAALLLTFTSSESFSYSEPEYEAITDYDMDDSYGGTDLEGKKSGNFYMGFNYNGISPTKDSFSARENNHITVQGDSNFNYKNAFAGNASVGYKTGNFRVELEGMISSADVDIEIKNPRSSMINFDGLENKHSDYYVKIFEYGDNGLIERFSNSQDKLDQFKLENKDQLFKSLKMTNKGSQSKAAAMINTYFDINNSSKFTPYLGIGGGFASIKLFGVSKIQPAVQGKLGLNYNVSDKVQLSAGYRYFLALGDNHVSTIKLDKEIHSLRYEVIDILQSSKVIRNDKIPGATTATVESKFANHALEVGLKFNF